MTRGTGDKGTACRPRVVQRFAQLRKSLGARVSKGDVRHHRRGRKQAGVIKDDALAGDGIGRRERRPWMVGRPALPADERANTGRRTEQQCAPGQSAGTPCDGMLLSQRGRGEDTTSAEETGQSDYPFTAQNNRTARHHRAGRCRRNSDWRALNSTMTTLRPYSDRGQVRRHARPGQWWCPSWRSSRRK